MKGQVKQVFIYGMMILMIGFVILIAVRSFSRIDDTRCDAEKIGFQRDMNKYLEENSVWGRENTIEINPPCDYEVVCFVDARSITDYGAGETAVTLTTFEDGLGFDMTQYPKYDYEVIKDSVQNQVEMNIFLVKPGEVEPYMYDEKIRLESNDDPLEEALCMPSKAGRIKFRIAGQGRTVLIKPSG